MNNTHRLLAILSIVCNVLGIVCLLFLLFTTVWSIEVIVLGYIVFFVLALVLGGFSLIQKNNMLALVAVLISVFFLGICLLLMYKFKYVDYR